MGTMEGVDISNFICRLCSQFKPLVIHIYGQQGRSLALHQKILQLPVKLQKSDKLPKTICLKCINSIIHQSNLIARLKYSNVMTKKHMEHQSEGCPEDCPFNSDFSQSITIPEHLLLPSIDVNSRKVDFRSLNPNANVQSTNMENPSEMEHYVPITL